MDGRGLAGTRSTALIEATLAVPRGVDERAQATRLEAIGVSSDVAVPRRTRRSAAPTGGSLLERGREDTYKVKAFRGARGDDPAAAARAGRAAGGRGRAPSPTLPGVGASSAKVIAAAVPRRGAGAAGRPGADTGGPLAPPAAPSCGPLLRGDLHSHSDWSDGGSPIEEMAFTAMELGHEYLVLTDHRPALRSPHGSAPSGSTRQLGVVDAVNDHLSGTFTSCLKGIEVDILDDGSLDQDDELLARLDVQRRERAL